MRRVATHKNPDLDALVATWLAERYLFAGEEVEVVFVGRRYAPPRGLGYDCVVDVSNTYDPGRLVFDHKPPAFADRNQTCATRLLWEHLLAAGKAVSHLAGLVDAVHDGDSVKRRARSSAYRRSRQDGLHAHFRTVADRCADDHALYAAVCTWLDSYDKARPDADGNARRTVMRNNQPRPKSSGARTT